LTPLTDKRNHNLFKLKPVTLALAITFAALSASAATNNNKNRLPEIGSAGGSVLSLDKERQIGDVVMRQLRASQPVLNDPVLNEYINDLGNKLVKNADNVNFSFTFFLVNKKELNAFAFFGGHVGIHGGLLTTADNESELASVIAHEISHVTLRHLARRLENQSRSQTLSTAGMISGLLLALINPTAGIAALQTSMAISKQANINYTRGNEKEADRVGIRLLANSDFDPNGAPNFFRKMAKQYRYKSTPPAMLLTHPLPESRIAQARVRAQGFAPRRIPASLNFELAKARIKARYQGEPSDNIVNFKYALSKKTYKVKQAAEYGLALSYFENAQYKKSQKILTDLLQKDKDNAFYLDTLTDVYIQLKQHDKAIAMLSEINLLKPNNQVITLNYANVLQEAKHYDQAAILLQDFLLLNPGNFIAYDLLTQIYRSQGKTALMHVNKAEVYALLGAYSKAVDELQTGYDIAERRILQKRIKGRILQFQAMEQKVKRL
jgi:predicted Zn-dependent protease